MSEPDIITRVAGQVGRITLNRPKALNALTLWMVEAMTEALLAWREDDNVHAVVVDGAGGKAFCAGGDIRLLYESGKTSDGMAENFWREEYRLNTLIKRYPKPYVALIDGIVMGGGVGVSVHGGYRVTGDATRFAMPETGIGFFPDVGGTYFLPRLPGEAGLWMGLTGARLKAPDCLAEGVSTHHVPSDRHDALTATFESADLEPGAVEGVLADFSTDPGPSSTPEERIARDALFSGDSVEAILETLERAGGWPLKQAEIIRTKSPTALKLTFRAIREGAALDFEDAMRRELALAVRCLDDEDFAEGVRAVIIDKDNAPRWNPATLGGVSDAAIERYFDPKNAPDITFIP